MSKEEPESTTSSNQRYRIGIRVWDVKDGSVKTLMSASFEGPSRVVSESARVTIDEFFAHEEG